MSKITNKESSQQEGVPYECYMFDAGTSMFFYTSDRENITLGIEVNGRRDPYIFYSTYIRRGEIEPGSQGNECTAEITVAIDNPVANLYKGMPPEGGCKVGIIRGHHNDYNNFDTIYQAEVQKVSFENTVCKITIILEHWLNREVPRGKYQYTCNNVHYDHNCGLDIQNFKVNVFLDRVEDNYVYSNDFINFPDGYFTNGKMWFNGQVRMIESHENNVVKLRYPFSQKPRNYVDVAPGCDKLFLTCAGRYNNEKNFTGFPYVPPTDTEKNPYGVGTYWMNTTYVWRDSRGWIGSMS